MTSITDIPISDIKLFLEKNKIPFNIDTAYDTTWRLLRKGGDFSTYNHSIIEWLRAYNLIKSKINVKEYSEREINNMSLYDKETLAKLLTIHENETEHIINILRYMGKLKKNNVSGRVCNHINILEAIDNYWSDIYEIPIKILQKEYGLDVFNLELFEIIWDNLHLPRYKSDIYLRDIVNLILQEEEFEYYQKEAKMAYEELNKRYKKTELLPEWDSSWDYLICLLQILQSDERTRSDFLI